jgi:4-hydroxy-4-methyl-2-oxoglutarate aldolase
MTIKPSEPASPEQLTPADIVAGARGEARILPFVRALYSSAWAVGPAATCVCAPADNLALHRALATAAPGSVLVCDAGGRLDGGYLGELMASDALNRSLAGLVISGSVRDARQLEELGFPVFCLGTGIPSCQKARAISVGEPITIDGVYVEPGDQIAADRDGVVVVPQAAWPAASENARALQDREAEIAQRLAGGERLAEILSLAL